MSSVQINNLWVEDTGANAGQEAVLCIHGLGGSSNFWTPLLPALGSRRIVRPDLAGSARSVEAPKNLSVESHVESLVHVLDALGIEKAHVLAHSMGTIVAQHLAVNHPDRVSSLVLFGPLLAPPEAAREPTRKRAQLARTGAAGMQEIADAIAKGATSNQTKEERPAVTALVRESIMRQPAEGYALNCEALAKAHAADIKNVKVPVLLVTGDEDTVGVPQNVEKIAGQLAKSKMHVLSGCGHWTVYEKPLECVQITSEFYKQ